MTVMTTDSPRVVTESSDDYNDRHDLHDLERRMTRQSPVDRTQPRYAQIADDLRTQIEAGTYPPGARLPTEPEMQARYQASSTTVRAAMRVLSDSGIVETQHGRGTFVIDRRLIRISATHTEDLAVRAAWPTQDSWSTDIIRAGRRPTQRFECLMVAAGDAEASILHVAPGDPLVMRRCWRSVDGVPASIEASVFPKWLVDELPALALPHDIAEGTTMYVSRMGHPMRLHRDVMSARPPSREEVAFFGVHPAMPSLIRVRTSYEQSSAPPLRIMTSAYRSDLHEISYDVAGQDNPIIA